jgi:hypothetical protein
MLSVGHCGVDALDRDGALLVHHVHVHADDWTPTFLHVTLVLEGDPMNFTLLISVLHRFEGAASLIDLVYFSEHRIDHHVRQSFNVVGAGKRVDNVCDARFIRDDLLGTERDGG